MTEQHEISHFFPNFFSQKPIEGNFKEEKEKRKKENWESKSVETKKQIGHSSKSLVASSSPG